MQEIMMKDCYSLLGKTIFVVSDTLRSHSPSIRSLGLQWFEQRHDGVKKYVSVYFED